VGYIEGTAITWSELHWGHGGDVGFKFLSEFAVETVALIINFFGAGSARQTFRNEKVLVDIKRPPCNS
jgi:hypothetical protein